LDLLMSGPTFAQGTCFLTETHCSWAQTAGRMLHQEADDGAIPRKYKELIAVAVALTTQCPYCIEIHKEEALKAGATEVELTEAMFVAAALRAGGTITHGTHLISA
jgi:AhpD family alkylhydroperoxidase